jgi:hypothetical protein
MGCNNNKIPMVHPVKCCSRRAHPAAWFSFNFDGKSLPIPASKQAQCNTQLILIHAFFIFYFFSYRTRSRRRRIQQCDNNDNDDVNATQQIHNADDQHHHDGRRSIVNAMKTLLFRCSDPWSFGTFICWGVSFVRGSLPLPKKCRNDPKNRRRNSNKSCGIVVTPRDNNDAATTMK